MGARPSTHRKATGGRLNGVDGKITGYRWTDEFNGEAFEPGNYPGTKDPKFHWLYLEYTYLLDGAEDELKDLLKAGDFEQFEVSDDELTLTAVGGGEAALGQNQPAARFINSLVEANFDENRLSDDPDSINYEPIIGTRVRFVQSPVLDRDGKPKQRLVKKGTHKGKTFPVTTTTIDQVYELPGTKGSKKTAAPVATKGKKTAVVEEADEEETVESLATAFILKVVAANKGKLAKAKVSMALLKPENGMSKHPQREAVRKLVLSDKFLNTEDGWSYNEDKEVITVEATDGDDD